MYVSRYTKTHFLVYKRRCEERGILMHERAIPAGNEEPGLK
jgi:hypothetical protein